MENVRGCGIRTNFGRFCRRIFSSVGVVRSSIVFVEASSSGVSVRVSSGGVSVEVWGEDSGED